MYTVVSELQHMMDFGSSPRGSLTPASLWALPKPGHSLFQPTALPPLVISFHIPLLPLEGAIQKAETLVPPHIRTSPP